MAGADGPALIRVQPTHPRHPILGARPHSRPSLYRGAGNLRQEPSQALRQVGLAQVVESRLPGPRLGGGARHQALAPGYQIEVIVEMDQSVRSMELADAGELA